MADVTSLWALHCACSRWVKNFFTWRNRSCLHRASLLTLKSNPRIFGVPFNGDPYILGARDSDESRIFARYEYFTSKPWNVPMIDAVWAIHKIALNNANTHDMQSTFAKEELYNLLCVVFVSPIIRREDNYMHAIQYSFCPSEKSEEREAEQGYEKGGNTGFHAWDVSCTAGNVRLYRRLWIRLWGRKTLLMCECEILVVQLASPEEELSTTWQKNRYVFIKYVLCSLHLPKKSWVRCSRREMNRWVSLRNLHGKRRPTRRGLLRCTRGVWICVSPMMKLWKRAKNRWEYLCILREGKRLIKLRSERCTGKIERRIWPRLWTLQRSTKLCQFGEHLSAKKTHGKVGEAVHGMQASRVENISFTSCIRKIDDRDLRVRHALRIKDCAWAAGL